MYRPMNTGHTMLRSDPYNRPGDFGAATLLSVVYAGAKRTHS